MVKLLLSRRPSPAMVVACIALFVSLSAAGYATTVLPANSVGSREVKNGSLRREDFRAGVLPQPAISSDHRLNAVVSGSSIAVRDSRGARVTTLAPGVYEFSVHDQSRLRNFHLVGPGVDRRTGLAFVGTTSWRLTLSSGHYAFQSDGSPLRGAFRVG
jgi:hypothetical protein